jgi:cob(I)alamin adenosyltransferase
MNLGLVHLYIGDGKGKTTAAAGLAVRAVGDGIPVLFVQFLKNQPSGELESFRKLGITVLRGKAGEGFTDTMTTGELEESRDIHNQNLRAALDAARRGECGLLVLDEAMAALNLNLLDGELIRDFLDHRPEGVEVVLTGRNPPQWLLDRADYITEMKKLRHPYDKGITARLGIEQ